MKSISLLSLIGALSIITQPGNCDSGMNTKDAFARTPIKHANPIHKHAVNKKAHKKTSPKNYDIIDRFSIWELSGASDFKDDFFAVKQKGDIYFQAVGANYRVNSDLVLGAFYLFDRINSHSPINSAKMHQNINSVFPYLYYYFNPGLYFYLAGGYGHASAKLKELDATSTPIHGHKSGNIQTLYPALVANLENGNYLIDLKLSYIYSSYKEKSYTLSNSTVINSSRNDRNNMEFLADFGYRFMGIGSGIKALIPYVQGGLDYDVKRTKVFSPFTASANQKFGRGRDGYTGGAILKVLFSNDLMLGLRYKHTWGHSHLKINAYSLDLSFKL